MKQIAPRRVVIYGIQPTGCPHLGNLLSLRLARGWRTQKLVFCIADLHSLTSECELAWSYKHRVRAAAAFALACTPSGVCCLVYLQSSSLAQTWLFWITTCLSKWPELERASAAASGISIARVLYPSLMAADIIACRATHIVAGYDQKKHLEYVKLMSKRINAWARAALAGYELLPEASFCVNKSIKLMSLQSPDLKMSKSDKCELASIQVLDNYNVISNKIARAKTDSGRALPLAVSDLGNRLGLANLIEIYALAAEVALDRLIMCISTADVDRFKCWLAKLVYARTHSPRLTTARWLNKPEALDAILAIGSSLVSKWASSCADHIRLITELKQRF